MKTKPTYQELETEIKELRKKLSNKNNVEDFKEIEHKKLSEAVAQSANIIVITDTDGNIEYVNENFTETTGYSQKEAIGQNPRLLNAGKQEKEYYTQLWETIKAGKKWKGEFKNDGGTKLRETFIRVRKKLPDFFTDEGKIFYALSKNRYIGTTTAELAKVIGKGILETIPILIKLYEKGLIILLQEGEHLSEDLWDVAATLRKSDPDVEKMLYTTKYLEETLNKTLKDLQEEKDSIK